MIGRALVKPLPFRANEMSALRVGEISGRAGICLSLGSRKRPLLFDIVDLEARRGERRFMLCFRAFSGWFMPVWDGLGTEDLGSIMSCNFKVVTRFTRA